MNNKFKTLIGLLLFCAISFSYGQDASSRDKIIEEQAYTLGTSAYLWGFTMNELYRNRDNFLKQEGNELNKFNHFQTLLTPSLAKEMGVVSANIATLYSNAWLDVSIEPIILDFPEIQGRYFTFNYVDYYQVNGNLSSQTVSRKRGSYAFVGPGWKGILPENVHRVEVNTNTIWILGRTEVKGDDDFDAVIELQKEYSLTSLSEWINGNRNTTGDNKYYQWPLYDLNEPLNWFKLLNEGLRINPPNGEDKAMLNLFETIQVGPHFEFDIDNMDRNLKKGLYRAIETGNQILTKESQERIGKRVNSWVIMSLSDWSTPLGGIDFVLRSAIALRAQPGQDNKEAMYYISFTDDDNQSYSGDRKYEMTFQPNEMPPTPTFWTLMVYSLPDGLPVENPINRFQLGTYDELKKNKDGSITIYIQSESPGKSKESNWLPSKDGAPFYLGGRVYTPEPAATSHDWVFPTVIKIN